MIAPGEGTPGSHDGEGTVVGRGAVLEGSLRLLHDLRVEGVLRGSTVSTRGVLLVDTEGEVHAEAIEVDEAVIRGRVSGTLRASRGVRLEAGATFHGDLETPRLLVDQTASITHSRPQLESAAG